MTVMTFAHSISRDTAKKGTAQKAQIGLGQLYSPLSECSGSVMVSVWVPPSTVFLLYTVNQRP